MNQQEFLSDLKQELINRKVQNIQEILADYEEHFTHGKQKGLAEDEIVRKLGSPSTLAKAYETESLISEVRNPETSFHMGKALRVVGRLLVLAPFNFLVLFIPGTVTFSLITAGWSIAVALLGVGFAIFSLSIFHFGLWMAIASVAAAFGLIGLAVLSGIIMFWISKMVLLGLINFMQWNLKFVLEK